MNAVSCLNLLLTGYDCHCAYWFGCMSVCTYIFFWSGRPRVQLQVLAGNTKITEHSCMIYRTYTDLINAQPRLLETRYLQCKPHFQSRAMVGCWICTVPLNYKRRPNCRGTSSCPSAHLYSSLLLRYNNAALHHQQKHILRYSTGSNLWWTLKFYPEAETVANHYIVKSDSNS